MHRLPIVTRAEWGAKPAKAVVKLKHPVNYVALSYHTSVKPCDYQAQCIRRVRRLQEKHMAMGLLDIHYNFIIGGDGMIYEGRGWHFQPSKRHTTIVQPEKTHGKRIDIAFLTNDANPRDRFHPPHLIAPPGLRCIHYGVNHGFLRVFYEIIEDKRPVKRTPNPDKKLDISVL